MGKRQADDGEDFTSPKVKKAKAGKADKAAAGKAKASKSPKAEAPKSGGPVGLVKGEDAEGVPFWEVCLLRVLNSPFRQLTHCRRLARTAVSLSPSSRALLWSTSASTTKLITR